MLPNKLENYIVEKTRDFFRSDQIDNLLSIFDLEAEKYKVDDQAEANLLRILDSLFDKVSFFIDALKYPHHLEIIVAAAAASNYLTDIIVRNPEFLYQVYNQEYLSAKITLEKLNEEAAKSLSNYKSFESKLRYLKTLKRRLTLKIGLNDILKNYSLVETYEAISITAKVLLSHLFNLCVNVQLQNYKEIISPSFSVVSLGKLGGNELNYSSDVDLIVFYEKTGNDKIDDNIFDLLNKSIQNFIWASSNVDQNGFLYRIDFRLRPDGKNSPLCRTMNDFLRYYETRGEDWERQMLIKADFLTGNKVLFDKFINYIQYYVYPSSSYKSPIEQIRKMKQNIEIGLSEIQNIKLFSGGIRDIEFSVQALQLLYGGKNKKLRSSNTITAIEMLKEAKILSEKESLTLSETYIFYRKIEHFLQLMNNTQSHTIPDDLNIKQKLSGYLGLKSFVELDKTILSNRKKIRKIFLDITGAEKYKIKLFDKIKFEDRKNAERNYRFIKSGEGLITNKSFERSSIEQFTKIETDFIERLNKSVQPDLVLQNFSNFIKSVSFPSVWYKQFENKTFLQNIMKLCEFSPYSLNLLINDRSLGDLLLTGAAFNKSVNNFDDFSLKTVLFILSVRFSIGVITRNQFSTQLANYIDSCIQKTFGDLNDKYKFSIIGLGSLGTKDITIGSDIDIIILIETFDNFEQTQNDFKKKFIKLREVLGTFEIDSRLRPEGKSSYLVWDLNGYKKYFENRLRVWEMLALSKSRFLCGDIYLYKSFIKLLVNKINMITKEEIFSELQVVHKKIHSGGIESFSNLLNLKKTSGALLDIDYLIGYLTLTNSQAGKLIGKENIFRIKTLTKENEKLSSIIPLIKNEEFLRKLDLSCKMMNINCGKINSNKKITASLEKNYFRKMELINNLEYVLKENRKIFNLNFKI